MWNKVVQSNTVNAKEQKVHAYITWQWRLSVELLDFGSNEYILHNDIRFRHLKSHYGYLCVFGELQTNGRP